MTLGGLWHGAAWTFLLWGLWHGVALSIERTFKWSLPKPVGWTLTFLVVMAGWVLFRSESLDQAGTVLNGMLTMSAGITWYPPLVVGAIIGLVAEHGVWSSKLRRSMRLPILAWYSPIVTSVMIWALFLYAPQGFRPFVYFQF